PSHGCCPPFGAGRAGRRSARPALTRSLFLRALGLRGLAWAKDDSHGQTNKGTEVAQGSNQAERLMLPIPSANGFTGATLTRFLTPASPMPRFGVAHALTLENLAPQRLFGPGASVATFGDA